MIEATAVAVNSAGIPEIAAGSTRDSILLLRSLKLIEQVDQPRFLLSISLEAARTFLKGCVYPKSAFWSMLTGLMQNTVKGTCVLNLRVAKAYR